MAKITSISFAGVHQAIRHVRALDTEEVNDDLEAEQEAMPDIIQDSFVVPEDEGSDTEASNMADNIEKLNIAVMNASKGVKEDTDKQYKR